MSTEEHKSRAPKSVTLAILTVSTTRTLEDDKSGLWMKKRAEKKGHDVLFHEVVPDDQEMISSALMSLMEAHEPHAILVTGGTGIGPSDVTIEALRPMFTKELTAFGPLFSFLSYEEIDAAALLSRATAGLIGQTLVFCLPGSLKACKLACKELIFPELGHLLKHVQEV
ncbi:MAG: MogA/MoaB family molybdenum cofactor biosynthesis protein [Thermodesulfobacteriota bacterium]|nr:MogA/MoaB family molybdenum cofactor biosynthesis protein [Thermodesulfobacteriota bacterium]